MDAGRETAQGRRTALCPVTVTRPTDLRPSDDGDNTTVVVERLVRLVRPLEVRPPHKSPPTVALKPTMASTCLYKVTRRDGP